MAEGHKALLTIKNFSKDIIVVSRKEFDSLSPDSTRFFYVIKHQGKKIYARA